MKTFRSVLVLAAIVVLATFTFAGEDAKAVTITGKIVCAKCTLQKPDAKECQDVLVVDEKGAKAEYYLVKNEVAEKYGHVCQGEKGAVVTGTVTEKDGKAWLAATKMEQPKG